MYKLKKIILIPLLILSIASADIYNCKVIKPENSTFDFSIEISDTAETLILKTPNDESIFQYNEYIDTKKTGIGMDYVKGTRFIDIFNDGKLYAGDINSGIDVSAYCENVKLTIIKMSPVELAKNKCNMGNVMGCHDLGVMYDKGQGLPQNDLKALSLFKKACDGGYVGSCITIGVFYDTGQGVTQDHTEAIRYYKKACNEKNFTGCKILGNKYYDGKDVKQDYYLASKFFKKGCENNDASACFNLGTMFASGKGKEKNYTTAANYFEQACTSGYLNGCNTLGYMYQKGQGRKKNYSQASKFFKQACDGKVDYACTHYKSVISIIKLHNGNTETIKNGNFWKIY